MNKTNCQRCGKEMEKRGARKYCLQCRKEIDKELANKYVENYFKKKKESV